MIHDLFPIKKYELDHNFQEYVYCDIIMQNLVRKSVVLFYSFS